MVDLVCRRGIVDVCNILQRRVCGYTRYCGVGDATTSRVEIGVWMTTVGVFYSSDGNIRCLCADQSGRKINEVGEEAR